MSEISQVLVIGIYFEQNFTCSDKFDMDNIPSLYSKICKKCDILFDQILVVGPDFQVEVYEPSIVDEEK